MKQINNFIQEKLNINSKSKVNGYDPDFLNNFTEVLYDDEGDEDELDSKWNYCESELKRINKNYSGFVVTKWNSISQIKDFDKEVNDYSNDLEEIKDRIITGRDLGYEVRVSHGHLEFDCINSGSRATYYVYALKDTAYADVEAWFDGELDENDNEIDIKKVLFTKGNIEIITI